MPSIAAALLCAVLAGTAARGLSGYLRRLVGERSLALGGHPHVWLAALAAAGAVLWAGSWPEALLLAGAGTGLALLVVADLAVHRLPDAIMAATTIWVLVTLFVIAAAGGHWAQLGRALLAGVVIGAGFFLLCLLTPGGIGLGDAKLASLLGLLLGWFGWSQVLVALLCAFSLGGVFAIGLIVTRRAGRRSTVAFGPWLVAGAAVALAWSPAIAL